MAITKVNGVELYYEVDGTGDWLVLTHGSWTDASGWQPIVARLSEQYRVAVWDRRGHSRSEAGTGPGSRDGDAADLAALIEQLSDEPVHLVGNSYGGNITLTLVATRPDLVATAAAHEPPLWDLLQGTHDPVLREELANARTELAVVQNLIRSDDHRSAAEYFIDHVAPAGHLMRPSNRGGLAQRGTVTKGGRS